MKPSRKNLICRALMACAISLTIPSAYADKTWTGVTDGLWATTTNWVEGALPGTTEAIIFDANSTANLTITAGANRTIKEINLTDPAGTVTINGNTISLGNGSAGIKMASATQNLTLGSGLNVLSSDHKLDVASGRTLTLSSLSRANGVNNDTTGGNIQITNTGTIKLGTAAVATVIDGGGNPFLTLGQNNWAATDATGTVIAATNTAWAAAGVGTTFVGNPADVVQNVAQSGNGGFVGIRFADSATAHTVTMTAATTFTGRGILMTPTCVGGTITGGNMRPNRVSTAGAIFSIFQHSTIGDLVLDTVFPTASSSAPVAIAKSGNGKVIFARNNGTNGRYYNYAGTMQFGNGGATGSPNGTGEMVNHGTLVFNRTADLTITNPIQGSGSVVKQNTNTLTLNATSNYTGATSVTGGLISIGALANLGATSGITLDGGGITWSTAVDISTIPITIASGGATIDTPLSISSTLANPIGNSGSGTLTKTGTGKLTLGGANTYSGNTTVNAGTLSLTNTSGSATGSGASVTIQSGAVISGNGITTGAVTVNTGATVIPGDATSANEAGTLTTGDLILNSGSAVTFNLGGSSDLISAANVTLNGGAITLLQTGSITPFAAAGTYNLIQYSGSITGTGIAALTVANPQSGFNYNFGTAGGYITVTISTSGLVADWITDGFGAWGTSANWSGGNIPDNIGNTARMNTNLTEPATITLDAARTLGSITFVSSPNSYTIAPGASGSLTLNSSTGNAAVSANAGTHTISAPIALADSVDISAPLATTGITLSGVISGTGGIIKTGLGQLTLSGANTYSGNVSLTGGLVSFANNSLGAGTALTLDNTTLQWATGNNQDITTKSVTLAAGTVGFDTNGNDVSLANDILGAGAVNKLGAGKLTLENDTSFTGDVTISAGSLQLGNGGLTGLPNGNIINNSNLILNVVDTTPAPVAFSNIISGTGSLSHIAAGTTELTQANTFSGNTTIAAGVLKIGNPLALQNSTVDLSSSGGTLSFGGLATATFGNLAGNGNLALVNENVTPLAVALTIGGNNIATNYAGSLSGSGSLNKVGSETTTLSGTNTYSGATTVTGAGSLTIDGAITTASLAVSLNGIFTVNNNVSKIIGATTVTSATAPSVTSATILVNGGELQFQGPITTSNANAAYVIKALGGDCTATDITLGRSALNYSTEPSAGDANSGLYLNGGNVSVSGALNLGTQSAANSSVSTRIDSGTLSVAGPVTVGLNNGGRWSIIDVNGGNFVSSNAAVGVALGSTFAGNATLVVRNSGIAKVKRIQMGQADLTGTSVINVYTSGELAVGSGGIVKTSTNTGFVSTIKLESATLSAYENWSTSLPIQVNGTTDAVTFKAADINGDPYDMTLSGAISGVSSVSKTGAGTVTMSGANTYTGDTFVNEGTLSKTKKTFADAADVYLASTGTLNLAFTGGDAIDELYIDNALQAAGTWGSLTSSADNKTALITGNGILYVGIPAPASEYGTWSALLANGLTANVNDGEAQDPDNDGIANLLEFVLGGLPMQAAQNILPAQSVTGSNLVFQFTRSDESESEVTLTVQYSNDLQNWTDIAIGASSAGMVTVTENGAAADTISVSIPKESNTKLFARLKAVK